METKQRLKAAIFQPTADKPARWLATERITVLIAGEQTNGAYAVVEIFTVPGGGPPPHIHHREDEMFYILEGEGTIFAGDDTIRASAGTCVHVPTGMVHHYKNEGNRPLRLLVMYTPAGFEGYFLKVGTPTRHRDEAPPPVTEETFKRFMAAAAQFHLEIVAPLA